VQVAVAGVKDVGAAQAILGFHAGDRAQHLGQALARNRAVHAQVVGRDAADGREGRLAPGPEAQAFGLVARDADAAGAGALEDTADALDFLGDFARRAVRFAEQDGGGVHVVTGFRERLDGADRRLVHHLQPGGNNAGGDDRGDRVAGFRHVVERGDDDLRELGLRRQFDRDLGDHREHAFRAVHQRQEVVAGRVRRARSDLERFAGGRQRAHGEHVMHGQAVLQAMHAARVFGDVAAQRAGDLRRRIGRVIEPEGRGGFREREVAHAGLHDGGARDRVDLEDLLEFRQRQQDPLAVRQCAARETRAGAARDDRYFELMAEPEDRLHLRFGLGQDGDERQLAVRGQAVAFVGPQVLLDGEQAVGRQQAGEAGDQALAFRRISPEFALGVAHLDPSDAKAERPFYVRCGPHRTSPA
jgi:hypothetical protein